MQVEFDTTTKPQPAQPQHKLQPYTDANFWVPEDWLALAGKPYRVAPPLAFLTPSSIALHMSDSLPVVFEGGQPRIDLDHARAFGKLDLTLTIGEWMAAFSAFLASLSRLFAGEAAKRFKADFTNHMKGILARYSPRAWPSLRYYDWMIRKRFFTDLAHAEASAEEGKVPVAPLVLAWNWNVWGEACARYSVDSLNILNVHKTTMSPAADKARTFAWAAKNEPKTLLKNIDELITYQRGLDEAAIRSTTVTTGAARTEPPFAPPPPAPPAHAPPPAPPAPAQQGYGAYGAPPAQQYWTGTLPNQHPSPRLAPPTPVQQHGYVVTSSTKCGMCGAVGRHHFSTCADFNATLLERRGGASVWFRATGQLVCNAFNTADGCRQTPCRYLHVCAACGDISGSHGLSACRTTTPAPIPASSFPRSTPAPSAPQPPAPPPAPQPSNQAMAGSSAAITATASDDHGDEQGAAKRAKTGDDGIKSMSELLADMANKSGQSFRGN